jgi:hypothetical protein
MLSVLTDKFVTEHNGKQTQSNLCYSIPPHNDHMSTVTTVKSVKVVLVNE